MPERPWCSRLRWGRRSCRDQNRIFSTKFSSIALPAKSAGRRQCLRASNLPIRLDATSVHLNARYAVTKIKRRSDSSKRPCTRLISKRPGAACTSPRGAFWGNSMVAKPEISISADEPQKDKLGQFWSPAKVCLSWPQTNGLAAPCVQISLVAPIRGQMTVDELRAAHMQAAHDVLNAALLSLEAAPTTTQRVKA